MLPGIRSVFKSRWHALFWAAGILWLAYEVAGSAPDGGNAADQQAVTDAGAAEKLLAGKF